ncbi:hypothetical protein ID866_12679, partial [Astraeus odoratus]
MHWQNSGVPTAGCPFQCHTSPRMLGWQHLLFVPPQACNNPGPLSPSLPSLRALHLVHPAPH